MAESATEAKPINGNVESKDRFRMESNQEASNVPLPQIQPEDIERKSRVDAVWDKMNKGVSSKTLNSILNKSTSSANKTCAKTSPKMSSSSWMTLLGKTPKKASSPVQGLQQKLSVAQNGATHDAKKLAAAALSAAKEAANATSSGRGKVEITEVRDFAGEEIEVKKFVDANSREVSDKGKVPTGPASAVDAVLEQIKKKQKLSVLDKTKKDWVEYKGENRGFEEELDAYKKSSNQYLDKVSFLQRADYREFERERDARLAVQAKRKPDMRGD